MVSLKPTRLVLCYGHIVSMDGRRPKGNSQCEPALNGPPFSGFLHSLHSWWLFVRPGSLPYPVHTLASPVLALATALRLIETHLKPSRLSLSALNDLKTISSLPILPELSLLVQLKRMANLDERDGSVTCKPMLIVLARMSFILQPPR